jgi:hypothetical protein
MNDQQLLRCSRHILPNEIGIDGQQHLLGGHALIIGLGRLGSTAAIYLGAGGVDRHILRDNDTLNMSIMRSSLCRDPACQVCGKDQIGTSAEKPVVDTSPVHCSYPS